MARVVFRWLYSGFFTCTLALQSTHTALCHRGSKDVGWTLSAMHSSDTSASFPTERTSSCNTIASIRLKAHCPMLSRAFVACQIVTGGHFGRWCDMRLHVRSEFLNATGKHHKFPRLLVPYCSCRQHSWHVCRFILQRPWPFIFVRSAIQGVQIGFVPSTCGPDFHPTCVCDSISRRSVGARIVRFWHDASWLREYGVDVSVLL